MLQYLVIYVFVVASFASEQNILAPKSPSNVGQSAAEIIDSNLLSVDLSLINKNASASSLLSQLLSVNPKDVSHVIDLIRKLIAQATQDIGNLDSQLASAKQDMDRKVAVDNAAQLAKDKAHAAVKRAQTAYEAARIAKERSKVARDLATIHHQEMTDRVKVEKPELEAQLKVLKQVLALLNPLVQGPKLSKGHVTRTVRNVYKTFDISFDVYLNRFNAASGWQNIFQMAYGGGNHHVIAAWVHSSYTYLHLYNGAGAYNFPSFPLKIWNHVQFKQVLVNGKYMNSIIINGKIARTVQNTKPREFQNVKVYTASPWYSVADGYVKNIRIISKR
eukprot:TRINITY_DN10_c0_g2_i1.p1 TRINITY_DN10_c0_g2~~TRINITY_DN10_c0_g2_i1.p1  ORF type:complete len:333 (+),score=50.88 TRINITY_DN10_c0_g2_i1:125-1123(+)